MAYLLVAFIFAFAGLCLGYVVKEHEVKKLAPTILKYRALTENSKRYIDALISARMVKDEQTTYRERRK